MNTGTEQTQQWQEHYAEMERLRFTMQRECSFLAWNLLQLDWDHDHLQRVLREAERLRVVYAVRLRL